MIKIPKKIYQEMIAHALKEFPNEACGILGGKENIVTEIYCMENIEKSPESFLMNPKEQFKVMKDLRNKGLSLLAIFHSHPSSPPRPSKKDIDMALYDDVTYIIISLQEPAIEVKAFSIKEKVVTERDIVLF